MKANWYLIDDIGYVRGPFDSKSDAEDSIYQDWKASSFKDGFEAYRKNYTIFPQVTPH